MADPRMSMMSMVSTSSVKPNTRLLNSWNIPYDDVKFIKALGQGFFGTVYKGKYLGTDVAIKQLKDFRDEEASKKFENEVAMLQGVRHPGVVTFMGMIRHSTGLYIVTEFVGGGNLKQVIRDKKTPFPWALRRRIASDIAKALAYLHARRVIHRDLKSANVLLDEYQRAKIADFGLARSFSRNADKSVVGTMDWMAPEMLMGQRYTEKADVYSYGLVLFEMILRKKPDPDQYRTGTFNIDIKKVRAKTPKDCPEALFKVFENCVLSDPEARPSMVKVIDMLDEVDTEDALLIPEAPKPNKVTKKQTNRMSMFSNDYYSDDEDVDDDEEEELPAPIFEESDEEPEADIRARNRMSTRLKERAEKVFSTQYTPQYDSDNAGSDNDFYQEDSDDVDDDAYSDDSTKAVGSTRSAGSSGGGLAASIVTGVGSRGAGERMMGNSRGRQGSKGGRPPAPPTPPDDDSDDGFGSDHSFRSSDSKPKAPARPVIDAASQQKNELASELSNVLHQRKGSVSARRKMFTNNDGNDSPKVGRRPSLGRQGSRGNLARQGSRSSLGRKGSGGRGGRR